MARARGASRRAAVARWRKQLIQQAAGHKLLPMRKPPQAVHMEDDVDTGARRYYGRVVRRAWDDTWSTIGSHFWYSVAVLAAAALLGFLGARGESVSDVVGAVLAVMLVLAAFFITQLVMAPVRRAREVAQNAAERTNALEAQIPKAATGPFVEPDHEEALRGMLRGDRVALEHESHRPVHEPLDREMFAAHFADLDVKLAEWNEVVVRNLVAPAAIRDRFLQELLLLELELSYDLGALALGLASITERRALSGTLADEIPPALDGPDQLWVKAWTDNPVRYGLVEGAGGKVLEITLPDIMLNHLSEDDFNAQVERSLASVRTLLIDAQAWPEAHEILSAREPFLAFPREELLEAVKRALLKPKIVVALGCPGCA